jgi:hypothetical protein
MKTLGPQPEEGQKHRRHERYDRFSDRCCRRFFCPSQCHYRFREAIADR